MRSQISLALLPALGGLVDANPVLNSAESAHQLSERAITNSVTGNGLAWYDSNFADGTSGRSNSGTYVCYKGDASNFPAISTWMSFNNLFPFQQKLNLQAFDNSTEIQWLYNAITSISAASKVDPRVILSVIILESSGNLRVGCTTSYGGVNNCGIMQSYNSLYPKYNGTQQSVTQQVTDGTQGTTTGPGLTGWFNHAADTSVDTQGNLWKVLRAYNSGAVNSSNLSDGQGANPYYVSHIANYLQGWDGSQAGPSSCSFSTATPTPTATACSSSKYAAAPTQTVAGSTKNCCTWYTVQSGDTCDKIDKAYGITLDAFRSWNTYVNSGCTNIWAGYAYCVSSSDPVCANGACPSSAPAPSSTTTSKPTTSTAASSTRTVTTTSTLTTVRTTTSSPTPTSTTNLFGACPSGAGYSYTASNKKIFTQQPCYTAYPGNDVATSRQVPDLKGCAEYCAAVSGCVQAVYRTSVFDHYCFPKSTLRSTDGNTGIPDATVVNLVATATGR